MLNPLNLISRLWKYKDFVYGNVKREIQIRHSSTAFGMGWLVIHPLIMIVLYTVIFSRVMSNKIDGGDDPYSYSIFICIGIINWTFFTEITNKLVNVFLSNANLIKKISFPKIVLPVIVIVTGLVNYLIIFAIFILFLLVTGNFPGWNILYCIPILMVLVTFSLGLGLYLGIFNIFFRDIGQIFGVVLQVWFWVTPIVYPVSILPSIVQKIIYLNPLSIVFDAFHDVFVFNRNPNWISLFWVFIFSFLLCYGALRLFNNRIGEIVDEL